MLERMVFGRTSPTNPDVQDLSTKVESIVKHVSRAEGGNRDLRDVAQLGERKTGYCTRGRTNSVVEQGSTDLVYYFKYEQE